jgi:DNA mismatch repair protein MSH5
MTHGGLGPNASGKSVYLHQVALIVYLAHLGSFVPCQYAVVGLTDKILTRMRTKTSLSLRESTFQSDLKQACASISQCTPKSLVLLDEFGKGWLFLFFQDRFDFVFQFF